MFSDFIKNTLLIVKSKYNTKDKLIVFCLLIKLSVKKIFFKNSLAKSKVFGNKISGLDYESFVFLFKEIFCSTDYYFKSVTKSPLIVDCGANIGMATLYFKKLYPDSIIKCFEPNKNVYDLLNKNITNNNIANVETFNVALYKENTTLSFFTSDESGILRSSLKKDRGGQNEIVVNAHRLSDYLASYDKVDLIKIDVEGAESSILEDLVNSGFITKADNYIIEYHHNLNNEKPSFSEFLKPFEMAGFNYSIKANFYRVKGFQEILLYLYK